MEALLIGLREITFPYFEAQRKQRHRRHFRQFHRDLIPGVEQSTTLPEIFDIRVQLPQPLIQQRFLTQKLLPPMISQRWGRVINVSSVAGRYGIANMVDYSTTKGAVHSFTKALAKETSQYNVLVTSMSPGNVGNGGMRQNELSYIGRESSYDEQAEMICFLASENASYCSGQDFQVDGCRKKM